MGIKFLLLDSRAPCGEGGRALDWWVFSELFLPFSDCSLRISPETCPVIWRLPERTADSQLYYSNR